MPNVRKSCNRWTRIIPALIFADMAFLIAMVGWGGATQLASTLVAVSAVLLVPLCVLWVLAWILADRSARLSRPSLIMIWLVVMFAAAQFFSSDVRQRLLPLADDWAALAMAVAVLVVGIGLCAVRAWLLDGRARGGAKAGASSDEAEQQ